MICPEQYQDLLNRKGISLRELGIEDIALERSDALIAIQLLRNSSAAILGGDVYVQRDTFIELAYADWYADPKPTETESDYLNRTWDTAMNYIKAYPESGDLRPLFSLVLGQPL